MVNLQPIKIKEAKSLVIRASLFQDKLLSTSISSEIIERSTPVVWFGNTMKNNWVTIATNPSTREFLDRDNHLLIGENARFFVREQGVNLVDYANDDSQLESSIQLYNSYFSRKTTYRNWFGKPKGAKLEGFLNGMGGSLYNFKNYKNVVHTDFFPIATKSQMGKIPSRKELLDSDFANQFLKDTLDFLEPSLIIILGKEHCKRFTNLEHGIYLDSPKVVSQFPNSKYQLGFHSRLKVPVVGLHFKPSEQFIGLGGGADEKGKSHGEYAKKDSLDFMGNEILNELKKLFPNL
ncbi:hypothetical protein [Pseudoneobacillus rhizosphaerae]|uniref:Uracil-DNA glycosylase-like domain-containing protein n=1 Tax=Pseudoneobacillus rhizosphaerae TaxID=2880968 RepID=A0A9C7L8L5_9BACI|nr:hypothetical protein [Pseudoneobacillus rhizosphaerae]CAG9606571.1 hypothetical protein NEOCIP111885_00259 [Pseudoneobacillus rhizosphaerae]